MVASAITLYLHSAAAGPIPSPLLTVPLPIWAAAADLASKREAILAGGRDLHKFCSPKPKPALDGPGWDSLP